ncbi:PPC domain-containing protein [Chloroflexus sp.]|uniref:PPC domain-containing protein n=1 Tax=Chloroflexus sp. TaxID=1904827 RepID=UPI002ACDDC3C|nr:PPC domain-containing protein [Chloroflexus sp.]
METTPLPQPDPYEPDNDLQSARPIEAGATQQHNFIGRSDEDWLKLDLQAGQTYSSETFDLAADVDTVIELFDAQGQSLAVNDDSDGFVSRIEFRPSRSATYYVRITNIGVAMFGATYQVRVSVR